MLKFSYNPYNPSSFIPSCIKNNYVYIKIIILNNELKS